MDDAVAKGAKVLTGGQLPPAGTKGQFYPPTVIRDVDSSMRIMHEEVLQRVALSSVIDDMLTLYRHLRSQLYALLVVVVCICMCTQGSLFLSSGGFMCC